MESVSVGYIEKSGNKALTGLAFLELLEGHNKYREACCSLSGITQQVGPNVMIFAKIDPKILTKLFFNNNTNELVAIFNSKKLTKCMSWSYFTYIPGLLDKHLINDRLLPPEVLYFTSGNE